MSLGKDSRDKGQGTRFKYQGSRFRILDTISNKCRSCLSYLEINRYVSAKTPCPLLLCGECKPLFTAEQQSCKSFRREIQQLKQPRSIQLRI